MYRVVLVDDQELIRDGFKLMLSADAEIEIAGEASNGAEALELLRELASRKEPADVVLMDVRMSQMNGIEATAHITAAYPETRVLMLTTFDAGEYITDAVAAGASGFLLKDATPDELIRAIKGENIMPVTQDASQGDASGSAGGAVSSANASGSTGATPENQGKTELTDAEKEILELIGAGLNNAEIMAKLNLKEETVKRHIGRIFTKIGVDTRLQAVIHARSQP